MTDNSSEGDIDVDDELPKALVRVTDMIASELHDQDQKSLNERHGKLLK